MLELIVLYLPSNGISIAQPKHNLQYFCFVPYICAYMYAYMYSYVCIRVRVYVYDEYVYECVCVCVCMYMYVFRYILVHTVLVIVSSILVHTEFSVAMYTEQF